MTPCDGLAKRAASYFAQCEQEADIIEWDTPNKFVLIDNRRALHARSSAEDDPNRELSRLNLYVKSGG
jgi:alpha-ketoglutarate-dependent taurine dioxygenase